jgi:hypothetical protein
MVKTLLAGLLSFIAIHVSAQLNESIGGRAAAMGGASINQADLWSVENNMGAIAFYNKTSVGAYYSNSFLVKELALKSVAATYALKNSGFGLSLSQFGYSQYQENKIGLSYGIKLSEKFGVGAQLNYFNLKIGEGYGSTGILSAKVGVYTKINDELSLAATISNPTRAKLNDYKDERLPTEIQIGLNYEFSKKLNTSIQVSKDLEFDPSIHIGLEYQVIEILYLRAGIANKPAESSFGFGLFFKDFQMDFASCFDSNLGFSPKISLSYTFE